VAEITFDGGSGTLGNVLVGMTLLVGTSAGSRDKGTVRIRKTPGASTFYIGATSEVEWVNDLYLTVIDDFELRAKLPQVVSDEIFVDWDVAYVDQHANFAPVPVLGPHAVLKLVESTVDFEPDGSDSWVLGSTISSYTWIAPGASATANLNTATPTITYNSTGWKRVALTVTDANGKTATGYRRVFVYDDDNLPIENFELVKCIGDHENGGWEFEVRLFDEADLADVVPGALSLLFAEDWYGSTMQSLGPLAGYENLICMGRIDGETIDYDGQVGVVSFEVNGPQGWMNKITSSPATFTAANDQASTWSEFASPTVDKALFHLLHWRTNATQIMDIFLSGDTRRLPEIELPINNIWQQIEDLAARRMLAEGCCNRFGQLIVEIPGQLLAMADRSGIPGVMAITKDDWNGKVNIEYRCPQVGLAELAGLLDDTPEQVIMSRAPGIIPKRQGSFESWDGLVFDNQDHANVLSGLFLARENNPYPHVDINLAQNNRMMDLCPNQYVTLSVLAADNPRGIVWTDKKLIVRRIEIQHNAGVGSLMSVLECEADTDGPAGVTFFVENPMVEGGPGIEIPDFEDYDWPGLLPGDWDFDPPYLPPEPIIPPGTGECPTDSPATGPYNIGLNGVLDNTNISLDAVIDAILRTSGHDSPTTYQLNGRFMKWNTDTNQYEETLDDDFYSVTAYDINGNLVATGVHDAVTEINKRTRTGTLNATSATQIRRIKIALADSELLRVEDIVDNSIGESPGGSGAVYIPGTLSWGNYGNGLWIRQLNYKVTGIFGVGAQGERSPYIRSMFYMMPKGGSWHKGILYGTNQAWYRASHTGSLYNENYGLQKINSYHWCGTLANVPLWEITHNPPVSNTSLLHTGINEITLNLANPMSCAQVHVTSSGWYAGNGVYTLENVETLTYLWYASQYKIVLNSATISGVCPPAAV
jgi:hypothetical protein